MNAHFAQVLLPYTAELHGCYASASQAAAALPRITLRICGLRFLRRFLARPVPGAAAQLGWLFGPEVFAPWGFCFL
jgi:hypothetical protein